MDVFKHQLLLSSLRHARGTPGCRGFSTVLGHGASAEDTGREGGVEFIRFFSCFLRYSAGMFQLPESYEEPRHPTVLFEGDCRIHQDLGIKLELIFKLCTQRSKQP